MTEKQIQNAILHKWGTDPRVRLWRMNTGAAKINDAFVTFGIKGQADLSGILPPMGRRLEIEVKGQRGKQSIDQVNYQRMIESMGGIYILARSVEDVDKVLNPILDNIS